MLPQKTRFQLHYGPYRTPRFKYGATVIDLIRGPVVIVGIRDGRIPWPLGRPKGQSRSIVFYRGLVKAVRRESHQAIRHWWGVSPRTVWKWRRAVGVRNSNEGTHKLRVKYGDQPFFRRARRIALSKAADPDRRAKISAAKLGQPRPPHVIEAMRRQRRPVSDETRRKLSEASQRRGAWPPSAGRKWSAAEERLLRTLRPSEVAKRTGRTLPAVYMRRRALKLPDGRAGRIVTRRTLP